MPKPRTYQKHDKIEVIINETSLQKSEQSLETQKKYDLKAELSQFPSLKRLLEDATIADGIGAGPGLGINSDSSFQGDGTSERKDRFTARISALVIDVKPNGSLVIEATETQQFDAETKTLVVSGLCDPKDITKEGTVQSSQLAGLIIKVNHEGALKESSEKGIITRIFDAIFDF
ncbi:MAG: flagellar basal body L-ring protein FlgH [Phycisphaerales bacterium]